MNFITKIKPLGNYVLKLAGNEEQERKDSGLDALG